MPPKREFLIFRLWGPMAAWGGIAVGERRGSWGRPSRSGVLGLIAAALGIERSDTAAHRGLEEGLGLAVRVDHPGKPLRDYHTAEFPVRGALKRMTGDGTRRDHVLAMNEFNRTAPPTSRGNPVLSERGYYACMDALIALWLRDAASCPSLAEIAARLAEPVFTLYLGRKSCPLGRPPMPRIQPAESLEQALGDYAVFETETDVRLGKNPPKFPRDANAGLWLGEEDARALGLDHSVRQRTQRRDAIRDRARWLFDDRAEVEIGEAT